MVLIPLSPSGGKGRESRHVAVHGLPPTVSDEKINSFFSNYGRVQKVERQTTDDSVVVSFMDVRSAQKAHSGEKRMEPNLPFRITFHDPHVKIQPLSQPTTSIPSLMKTVVEPPKKPIVSSSTLNDAARMYAKRRDERNKREHIRAEVTAPSTSTSQCQQTASTSSQAIVVERLPVRSDSTIREQVRDHLKRFGKGIKDVLVEPDGELHRKATVVFNKVDAEKVIAEPQITILNSKVRLRIVPPPILPPLSPRSAAVQPSTSTDCLTPTPSLTPTPLDAEKKQNQQQPLPLKNADEVTVFHPKSSRTLYVGGLESRVSEESLRRRFTVYGDILDVDVKNFESPSPFAFLQFADINSAVRAINASAVMTNKKGKKFQPNFGRSMTSNKLWVGQIPDKVSEDYVTQKLKTLWDGNVDVVYDAREHQAIVIFPTNEASTFAYNRIRTGNPEPFVFKAEGSEHKVCADYSSDRLHDHFVDRKHQKQKEDVPPQTSTPIPFHVGAAAASSSSSSSTATSSTNNTTHQQALIDPPPPPPLVLPPAAAEERIVLAPPPNPPSLSEMPRDHGTHYRPPRRSRTPPSPMRRVRNRRSPRDDRGYRRRNSQYQAKSRSRSSSRHHSPSRQKSPSRNRNRSNSRSKERKYKRKNRSPSTSSSHSRSSSSSQSRSSSSESERTRQRNRRSSTPQSVIASVRRSRSRSQDRSRRDSRSSNSRSSRSRSRSREGSRDRDRDRDRERRRSDDKPRSFSKPNREYSRHSRPSPSYERNGGHRSNRNDSNSSPDHQSFHHHPHQPTINTASTGQFQGRVDNILKLHPQSESKQLAPPPPAPAVLMPNDGAPPPPSAPRPPTVYEMQFPFQQQPVAMHAPYAAQFATQQQAAQYPGHFSGPSTSQYPGPPQMHATASPFGMQQTAYNVTPLGAHQMQQNYVQQQMSQQMQHTVPPPTVLQGQQLPITVPPPPLPTQPMQFSQPPNAVPPVQHTSQQPIPPPPQVQNSNLRQIHSQLPVQPSSSQKVQGGGLSKPGSSMHQQPQKPFVPQLKLSDPKADHVKREQKPFPPPTQQQLHQSRSENRSSTSQSSSHESRSAQKQVIPPQTPRPQTQPPPRPPTQHHQQQQHHQQHHHQRHHYQSSIPGVRRTIPWKKESELNRTYLIPLSTDLVLEDPRLDATWWIPRNSRKVKDGPVFPKTGPRYRYLKGELTATPVLDSSHSSSSSASTSQRRSGDSSSLPPPLSVLKKQNSSSSQKSMRDSAPRRGSNGYDDSFESHSGDNSPQSKGSKELPPPSSLDNLLRESNDSKIDGHNLRQRINRLGQKINQSAETNKSMDDVMSGDVFTQTGTGGSSPMTPSSLSQLKKRSSTVGEVGARGLYEEKKFGDFNSSRISSFDDKPPFQKLSSSSYNSDHGSTIGERHNSMDVDSPFNRAFASSSSRKFSERPDLSISIPMNQSSGTPYSSAANTPASTSSKKLFSPSVGSKPPPPPPPPPAPAPIGSAARFSQSSSRPPTLAPPPQPPQLHTPTLKSPPVRQQGTMERSMSMSGQRPPHNPETPRSHHSNAQKQPMRPAQDKLGPRHDSMSSVRPPNPPTTPIARSFSVSDPKKTPATPPVKVLHEVYLKDLLTLKKTPCAISEQTKKLPKIEKKSSAQQASSSSSQHQTPKTDKEIEREKRAKLKEREREAGSKSSKEGHKEHKEHKQRRKEDGTLETKEERAKRKELEKLRKEKEERKREKERRREKEEKKRRKEALELLAMKKKKSKKGQRQQSSSESEEDEEDESAHNDDNGDKTESQIDKDHKLAMQLQKEQDLGHRLRKRDNKQDAARALALIRARKAEAEVTRRVLLDSSDGSDDDKNTASDDQSKSVSKDEKTLEAVSDVSDDMKKEHHSSGDESKIEKKKKKKKMLMDMEEVFGACSTDDDGDSTPRRKLAREEKSERKENKDLTSRKRKKKEYSSDDAATEKPAKKKKKKVCEDISNDDDIDTDDAADQLEKILRREEKKRRVELQTEEERKAERKRLKKRAREAELEAMSKKPKPEEVSDADSEASHRKKQKKAKRNSIDLIKEELKIEIDTVSVKSSPKSASVTPRARSSRDQAPMTPVTSEVFSPKNKKPSTEEKPCQPLILTPTPVILPLTTETVEQLCSPSSRFRTSSTSSSHTGSVISSQPDSVSASTATLVAPTTSNRGGDSSNASTRNATPQPPGAPTNKPRLMTKAALKSFDAPYDNAQASSRPTTSAAGTADTEGSSDSSPSSPSSSAESDSDEEDPLAIAMAKNAEEDERKEKEEEEAELKRLEDVQLRNRSDTERAMEEERRRLEMIDMERIGSEVAAVFEETEEERKRLEEEKADAERQRTIEREAEAERRRRALAEELEAEQNRHVEAAAAAERKRMADALAEKKKEEEAEAEFRRAAEERAEAETTAAVASLEVLSDVSNTEDPVPMTSDPLEISPVSVRDQPAVAHSSPISMHNENMNFNIGQDQETLNAVNSLFEDDIEPEFPSHNFIMSSSPRRDIGGSHDMNDEDDETRRAVASLEMHQDGDLIRDDMHVTNYETISMDDVEAAGMEEPMPEDEEPESGMSEQPLVCQTPELEKTETTRTKTASPQATSTSQPSPPLSAAPTSSLPPPSTSSPLESSAAHNPIVIEPIEKPIEIEIVTQPSGAPQKEPSPELEILSATVNKPQDPTTSTVVRSQPDDTRSKTESELQAKQQEFMNHQRAQKILRQQEAALQHQQQQQQQQQPSPQLPKRPFVPPMQPAPPAHVLQMYSSMLAQAQHNQAAQQQQEALRKFMTVNPEANTRQVHTLPTAKSTSSSMNSPVPNPTPSYPPNLRGPQAQAQQQANAHQLHQLQMQLLMAGYHFSPHQMQNLIVQQQQQQQQQIERQRREAIQREERDRHEKERLERERLERLERERQERERQERERQERERQERERQERLQLEREQNRIKLQQQQQQQVLQQLQQQFNIDPQQIPFWNFQQQYAMYSQLATIANMKSAAAAAAVATTVVTAPSTSTGELQPTTSTAGIVVDPKIPIATPKEFLRKHQLLWTGNVFMKRFELTINFHFVSGRKDLFKQWMGDAEEQATIPSTRQSPIIVNKRMRLENYKETFNNNLDQQEHVCVVGVSTGDSTRDVSEHHKELKSHFVEYLANKSIIGVATCQEEGKFKPCRLHMLPPSPLTAHYLQAMAPEMLGYLNHHTVGYVVFLISALDTPILTVVPSS